MYLSYIYNFIIHPIDYPIHFNDANEKNYLFIEYVEYWFQGKIMKETN